MKKKTGASPSQPIDWQRIHRQLDQLRDAVAREWTPSPDTVARKLQERAEALAAAQAAPDAGARLDVVEFCLGGENYALASACVREVFPLTELTYIPCTPPFVLGVVNVRGEILSVIDLKKLFGLPERGLTDLNKMIILHSDTLIFGVLADRIVGVRELAAASIQALRSGSGARDDFLLGLADGVIVLDAHKLLGDARLIVNENVVN